MADIIFITETYNKIKSHDSPYWLQNANTIAKSLKIGNTVSVRAAYQHQASQQTAEPRPNVIRHSRFQNIIRNNRNSDNKNDGGYYQYTESYNMTKKP